MDQSERDAVTTGLPAARPRSGLEFRTSAAESGEPGVPVFVTKDVSIYYGSFKAVTDVSMTIYEHEITAFIGSSGSGKTTVLRAFNRMNDLVPTARMEGEIDYRGQSLYGPGVSPIAVRRRIGMVFQKPNPFPKSIYDNVAYGPRINGERNRQRLDEIVERSLRQAALWDEVKNRLGNSGLSLSGGQAQRLSIARTIAVEPDVVLMDEPASALDPIATGRIEDLMQELRQRYTIVIVTHNMQQATRVSDRTAFFSVLTDSASDTRTGILIEYGPTRQIFEDPREPHPGLRHRPHRLTGRRPAPVPQPPRRCRNAMKPRIQGILTRWKPGSRPSGRRSAGGAGIGSLPRGILTADDRCVTLAPVPINRSRR